MTDAPDTFPRQNARTLRFTLGRPRSFHVTSDGQTVLFVRSLHGTDRVGRLWRWTQQEGEVMIADPVELLGGTDEDLSPEERARRERAREAAGGIVGYSVDAAGSRAAFALSGRLFVTEVATGATREVPVDGPVIDPRIDPTGRRVAFAARGGLHVVGTGVGTDVPTDVPTDVLSVVTLSPDGEPETVTWGLADFIAAEELDRSRGYWWSPDGGSLLTQRTDESPVDTWYVSNPANPDEPPTPQRYPAPGHANAEVSLWLISVEPAGPRRVEIRLPEWTEYIAAVHWSDYGDPVVSVLSRDQRRLAHLRISVNDGTCETIRTQESDSWVDVVPGAGSWASDGSLLTVEPLDGDYALLKDGERLSPAGLQVRAVANVDADGVDVYAAESAGDQQVWRLSEGSVRCLTPGTGWHAMVRGGDTTVQVSADLDHLLPTTTIHQDPAGSSDGATGTGHEVAGHEVTSHEVASFADQPLIEPRVHLLPGDADRPRVAVLLPSSGSPGPQGWPVLMDPYGGPHHASVAHHQAAFRESQWFADQGFAVVVVDGRGTPGSPEWERGVLGDFAGPVLEDQVVGLHAAAHAYPELDLARVAIRGWSFGGYLSALAVIDRPDVFHAAVVGAPVTDWMLYDTGYTERYLGVPNTEHALTVTAAYRESSLLERAPGLTRPLQLIHGLADDNVFVAHSLRLSSVLTAHGRPHEVIPLTGITHMATQEDVAENLLLMQVDFLRRALSL